ncbi:MAG: hypothetical protein ACRD3E_12920 [Terriglobales bacterium]
MMRLTTIVLLFCATAGAECIAFTEAPQHVGESRCVRGKVVNIGESRGGSKYLNFCDDYKTCAFSVVVFASNLKDVGDVKELNGKDIEIYGKVTTYRGRTEMILRDVKQLKGEAAKIPPLPKTYDVEKKGRYSAGEAKKK